MKSQIRERSTIIGGHRTSVSLEAEFWNSLKEIAHQRDMTLTELLGVYRDQVR